MRKLDGLQALRGAAAVMVVIDHAMRAAILQGHSFAGLEDFAGTIGRLGVNIFFVLSGFIMTYTTREMQTSAAGTRMRTFIRRRLVRLVPLYWLATAVTLSLGLMDGIRYRLDSIVTSLLFLPDFANSGDWRMPPIVGVGWTLNYESLFYLLFAGSLLLPRRLALITCVGAIVLLVGGGGFALHHVQSEPWHRVLAFYTFRNMAFFAIGIAIAVALRAVDAVRSQVPLWLSFGLIIMACSIYLALGMADGSLAWSAISAGTCAAVVALAALSAHLPTTRLNRVLLHLGDASFSIYLFHDLLMTRLADAIRVDFSALRSGVFIAAATFACLMLGSVIHSAVEVPLGNLLRRSWRIPRRMHSASRYAV